MAATDIKISVKQGTTTMPPRGNPPAQGSAWAQGTEQDAGTGKWSVLSAYWYSYSGSNATDGKPGEVVLPAEDNPDDYSFTVGPQGSETVRDVVVVDANSDDQYVIDRPIAPKSIWTVTETVHDTVGTSDTFDVYARDSSSEPVIMCDPIIRNKGGGGP